MSIDHCTKANPLGRLRANGLRLRFRSLAGETLDVLRGVDLDLRPGQTIGVTGASGSGKTSLLYALAGIEQLQAGTVCWGGTVISALGRSERDSWRRTQVGLVFQDFYLLPGMSILDNVLANCFFDHLWVPQTLRDRALELLDAVGVPTGGRHVASLSRGEQQRVAIARALLREPPIMLADEPTASLDLASGRSVTDLLLSHAANSGATLLVISHDSLLLEQMETVCRLEAGRIVRVADPFTPA